MESFNRHIHENLLTQIENQIEAWNRQAVRHSSPEEAHRLWQKAEGLQYALRVLYAFKPEFDDLVEAATQFSSLKP
ncbi:MAG: hypothetical protein LAP13_26035 [Acidobacteriia bacterium]|nr:hypothetical protein [Terriglobia bacterium]